MSFAARLLSRLTHGTPRAKPLAPKHQATATIKPFPVNARTKPLQVPPVANGENRDRGLNFIHADSRERIPDHLEVITAPGGTIPLLPEARKLVTALLIGAMRVVIVVNGDSARASSAFKTLRSSLRHQGYDIAGLYVSTAQVFTSIVDPAQDEEGRKVESADSIKLMDRIFDTAVRRKASDIHICVREEECKVLLRIHGLMVPVMNLRPEEAIEAVGVAYNKLAVERSQSKKDPQFNKNASQYCMIERFIDGGKWRIRYQSVKAEGGFDVVMRLLRGDAITKSLSLAELGYEESHQEQLRLAIQKPGALFLAGVTGSGKTTTQMTLMTLDPDRHRYKSYTVEDPVEYRIFGVTQYPIQRDISAEEDSAPFTEAIRVLMRADPDNIMIGELRDKDTCNVFVPAVLSGHRVMTTVHASSGFGIIGRLTFEPIEMPRMVLAGKNFIAALVYQALLPTLCPLCSLPARDKLSEEYLDYIGAKFDVDTSGIRVTGPGCASCKGGAEGVAGQTVVAEIVIPDLQMLRMIREGDDVGAELLWRQNRQAGFDDPNMNGKTAFEHAIYKCLKGLIDPRHIEMFFESFRTYEMVSI